MIAEITVPLIQFDIPFNIVVLGIITGFTYALIGLGLTLVYNSSRVLNLAAGEMGALPALLIPILVLNYGWPYWLTLPMALVGATVLGALVDFLIVRRLTRASRLTTLVATIGLAQALFGISLLIPRGGVLSGRTYPTPFDTRITIGDLVLGPGQLLILAVVPLLVLALTIFLRRGVLGRASRASAENSEAALLAGVPTARISLVVWALAGLLAGLAAILIGPTRPITGTAALGPALMLRALGAAMIGGLVSVPKTFVGGIVIGLAEALVLWNYPRSGVLELVLVGIIVASLLLKKNLGGVRREGASWSQGRSIRPLVPPLARDARVRLLKWATLGLVTLVGVLAPLALEPSNQFLLSRVVLVALAGTSLVVLTGYAGHVSLGQFAFVGVGAAFGGRLYQLGYPHVAAALGVILVGAAVAWAVGLPALRIRGLFLAVTTLGFALATSGWLFLQDWLVTSTPEHGTSLQIPRPSLLGIDFDVERNYYWLSLAIFAGVAGLVYRLRRSRLGRAMIAVRDNEHTAASVALSPRRVKLTAFVISGAIASLAGFMYGGLLTRFSTDPGAIFGADESLSLMVTAVFGGVSTVTGVTLGALWIEGIPRILGEGYALVSSGFGLILVILLLPGGLASLVFDVRDRLVHRLVGATPPEPAPAREPARTQPPLRPASGRLDRAAAHPVPLRAENVSVSFGGLQALSGVSIQAHQGEILGIMGPNGAGKTTLFDVFSGRLRPDGGRVYLDGKDVTTLPSHRRARLGLGRSFQQGHLFPDLTLVEALTVALERQKPTRSVPSLLGTPGARRRDRDDLKTAAQLIEFLDIGDYTHRPVNELPTGIRRLAQLGCVAAMDAHVLLLDEPTAGFTPREIESFARVVDDVREYLGATVVVIDHDVPMMRSVVERLYVLVTGSVIAEGDPSILETDERVASAYLGGELVEVGGSAAAALDS